MNSDRPGSCCSPFPTKRLRPAMGSISSQATRASMSARRASESPAALALARIGLAARGAIYILIGWLAIEVALGHSSQQPNQQGALQLLAGKSYGLVTLWLLGIGFAGYSLWRLSEAAFGVTGEKPGPGPRLKSLVRGIVYAFLAYLTFQVISGAAGNETRNQQDLTARLMRQTGGQSCLGILRLVIFAASLDLGAAGMRRKLMDYTRTIKTNP